MRWVRKSRRLRALVCALGLAAPQLGAAPPAAPDSEPFPAVVPGVPLQFPRDHGSHPDYRIEWWYVTGWIHTRNPTESLGFQITLFRVRPRIDASNPSAFTPRQILLGHCAIADPAHGRLWQEQRIDRATLGLAGADSGDLRVWMRALAAGARAGRGGSICAPGELHSMRARSETLGQRAAAAEWRGGLQSQGPESRIGQ